MESGKVLGPGNERCKWDLRLFGDDKAYIWWWKGGLRIESGKVGGRTCQLELRDLNIILLSDTI